MYTTENCLVKMNIGSVLMSKSCNLALTLTQLHVSSPFQLKLSPSKMGVPPGI